jgi:electron transfer flavoprotein beta subunit
MRIAVCVKAVPDGAAARRLDPESGRLDRSGTLAISAFDLHAVEEALAVRERAGRGEVVVVSLGPAHAAEALRKTLAMGADRSVLVSDDAFAGADLLVTAAALAAALRREEPALVLFGQQSSDGEGACLWAAVAEHLGLPFVSQVAELALADDAVSGRRQTEYGYERIAAPLPAIVAVSDAINEPRYPSLKGIMGAKTKPQAVVTAAELGGAGAAGTTVLGLAPPPPRGERRVLHDDGAAAEAIVAFLTEKRLLA